MVKAKHRGRLIYFHTGMVPSETAIETAYDIAHNVSFRSVDFYASGALEKTDAVAGDNIPDAYSKAFPVVTDAKGFKEVLNPKAKTKSETKEPVPTPATGGKGKQGQQPKQPETPQTGGGPNWNPQT